MDSDDVRTRSVERAGDVERFVIHLCHKEDPGIRPGGDMRFTSSSETSVVLFAASHESYQVSILGDRLSQR